jgi:hypothetical protein
LLIAKGKGGNEMKWTFWKAAEDYIHITPIVAFLNDEEGFYVKFGWLRWRCGFVIYKMK